MSTPLDFFTLGGDGTSKAAAKSAGANSCGVPLKIIPPAHNDIATKPEQLMVLSTVTLNFTPVKK